MSKHLTIRELIRSVEVQEWTQEEYEDYLDTAETEEEEIVREDMAGMSIYTTRTRMYC